MLKIFICSILIFTSYCLPASAQLLADNGYCAVPATPVYTMWLHGSAGRHAFERALVDLLLKKTAPTYGPYTLNTYSRPLNFERERIESLRAADYQIHIAPDYSNRLPAHHAFIRLPQPVAQGLLGYRRLIVRRDDVEKFSRIRTQDQFQGLVAGLGLGWPDVDIFQQNRFSVVASIDLHSLFAMLGKNRFDYIPLGAQDAQSALENLAVDFPNLTLEPNIVLYYPLALYLYVSAKDSLLVERLEKGLLQARLDGSYHHLFARHFGAVLGSLQQPNIRLFSLANDSISTTGVQTAPVLISLPASARL